MRRRSPGDDPSALTEGSPMGLVVPRWDAVRAIADPNRRRMLDAMVEADQTVGELMEALGIRQPGVSQQMQVLEHAARQTFYATRPAVPVGAACRLQSPDGMLTVGTR